MTIDLSIIPNPSGTFSGAGATIRADGRIAEARDQILFRLYFTVSSPENLPSTSVPNGSIAVASSDGFFNEQIYIWNDANIDLGAPLFKWRLSAATNDKNQGIDFRQQLISTNPVTLIGDPISKSGVLKEITVEILQPYNNNASISIQNSGSFTYVDETKINLTLVGTYKILFHSNINSFNDNGGTQLQAVISGNPTTGTALIYAKYTDDTVGSSLVFEPPQLGPDGTRPTPVPATPSGNLLLDDFPGASFAYSIRRLRDGYIGPALRVRRSNDDAEQDIGFDENDILDTNELTSFVGSNDAFVVVWYDQSLNGRNASTSTFSQQPQIMENGAILTENGIIALLGNSGVSMDTGFTGLSTKTILSVANTISPIGSSIVRILTSFSGSGAVDSEAVLDVFSGLRYQDGNTTVTIPGYIPGRHLHYARNNTTSLALSFDQNTLVTVPGASTSTNTLSYKLFEEGVSLNEYPTSIQEVIVYPMDQDVNRVALEANIFNFFFGLQNQGWNRKIEISLSDPSAITAQMDETVLPTEMIDSDNVNSARYRGGDIRITSDELGITLLPHVVEYFRATPGGIGSKASIWLRPEGNNSVWVWYSNPNATHLLETDSFGAYNVFSNSQLFMPCSPDRASQDLGPFQRHGRPGIIDNFDTITVFNGISEYAAWPSIIKRTIDGNLLCAFRRGGFSSVIDTDGYISIHLSTDQGLSWTELSTINQTDGTADARNPDLIQLFTGEIWCVYTKITSSISEVYYRVSNDGGATWGPELAIVAEGGLDDSKGKPIELINGNIGIAIFNTGTDTVTYYEWNGLSWLAIGVIAIGYNETSIIQDVDNPNSLYAFSSNSSLNGVWRISSADAGATWSTPSRVIDTNTRGPSEIQYLSNGDLLVITAVNRTDGVCFAFRSTNNGFSFETDVTVIAQESDTLEGLTGEGFYPSFVEIDTNIFGVVFYYDSTVQTQPTKILFRLIRRDANGIMVSYTSAGIPSQGILFDGDDNFIGEIGNNNSFKYVHETGTFTFRGVIQLSNFFADDVGAFLGNVASASDLGFFITYDNRSSISATREIRTFLANGSGIPIIDARISSAINDNSPHLIHVVGNGSTQTITVYVDGIEIGNQTGYNSLGSGSAIRPLNIGRQNHTSPIANLNGSLKHVALYDFPFDSSRIFQEHENWSNMISFWSIASTLTGGEAWTNWSGPSGTDPVFSPGDTFSTGLVQMDRSDDLFEINTNVIMKPSFNVNATSTVGPSFYFWTVSGSTITFNGLGSPANVSGRALDYGEAYRGTMDLISTGPTAIVAIIGDLDTLGVNPSSTTVTLQSIDTSIRSFSLLDSFDLFTTTIGSSNKLASTSRSFGCVDLGNNRLLTIHAGDFKFTQGAVTFSNTSDIIADSITDNIRIQVLFNGITTTDELISFDSGLTLQDLINSINTNVNLTSANITASASAVTGGVQLRVEWNEPTNISTTQTLITISEGTNETNPVLPKLFGSGTLIGFDKIFFAGNAQTKVFWAFLFDTTGNTLTLLDSSQVFSPIDVPYNTFEEGILSQDEDTFDWVVRKAGPSPSNNAIVALAQDSTKTGGPTLGLAFGIDIGGDTITAGTPVVFSDIPFGVDDPFSMISATSGLRTVVSSIGRESNDELQVHVLEVAPGTAAITSSSMTINDVNRSDTIIGLAPLGDDFYMVLHEIRNAISVSAGNPIPNGEGWSLVSSDNTIANTVSNLPTGSFVGQGGFTIDDGEYREWNGSSWVIVTTYPNNQSFDEQRARIIRIPTSTGTSITDEANILVRSDKISYTDPRAGTDRNSSVLLFNEGQLFYVSDGDNRRWPNGIATVHNL